MSVRVWAGVVVALFGTLAAASAAEWRVANADALSEAIARVQPGDVILLRAGEWTDTAIRLVGEGTPERPITLRAEVPGTVVLTGRSSLKLGGKHLVVEGLRFENIPTVETIVEFRAGNRVATDSRLTGCRIVDCNPPTKEANTKWVSLYGFRNRVDHCYIAGKTNLGTTLVVWLSDQPNDHLIDHNHFGPRPALGQNGGETIRVGTSDWSMHVSRTRVEFNLFEGCNGEVEVISNKSCENSYRYNTFRRCEGTLTLRHGNRCTVEGNFFLGERLPRTGGVRVIGEDHRVLNNYFFELEGEGAYSALSLMQGIVDSPLAGYYQVKRAILAFNTLVHCRSTLVIGQPGSRTVLPPQDTVIANNILLGSGAALITQPLPVESVRYRANLVYGGPLGIAAQDGLVQRDPVLVLAADGLWRPAKTSPARGAATGDFKAVGDDIDGHVRSTESRDIGCDQHSTLPVLRRPLTARDVGPAWVAR